MIHFQHLTAIEKRRKKIWLKKLFFYICQSSEGRENSSTREPLLKVSLEISMNLL